MGTKNRLTNVPTVRPIMRARDNGYCISAPILPFDMNGSMAKMVVSEVMMMGSRRS